MVRSLALLLILLVLCPLSAGAGQPDGSSRALATAAARGLVEQAEARYAVGDFAEARRLLARARRRARGEVSLLGRIELLYGLACAAENRHDEARTAWIRAVLLDPSLRIDPRRYKPSLVERFERARARVQASLEVSLEGPTEVTVWIDDRRLKGPPFRARLTPGGHRLEVRGPGDQLLLRQQVDLAPGQRARVMVATPRPTRPPTRPPTRQRSWAGAHLWSLISAGAALAAGGVALGVGLSAASDRDQACALLAGGELPCDDRSRLLDAKDRSRYEDLRAGIDTKRRWTNAMIGVSAGLAIVSVVVYWLEHRRGRAERPPAVGLSPWGLSPGGALVLRF